MNCLKCGIELTPENQRTDLAVCTHCSPKGHNPLIIERYTVVTEIGGKPITQAMLSRMQVLEFKRAFRTMVTNDRRHPGLCFIRAICATSDERMSDAVRRCPELIAEYAEKYSDGNYTIRMVEGI